MIPHIEVFCKPIWNQIWNPKISNGTVSLARKSMVSGTYLLIREIYIPDAILLERDLNHEEIASGCSQ